MKEIPHLAEAFAQVLRECRGRACLSQIRLARDIGCARSFISFLETQTHLPSLNTFLVVSRAIGMPSVELLARLETRLAALAVQRDAQPQAERQADEDNDLPGRGLRADTA